ncbi:MAG: phosphotransferase [Gammaproteobacteria bacterium]|nr:phosphotransferase [Gammaproteobacteria bacterium]
MISRDDLFQQWVAEQLELEQVDLQTVSGDASFRHYFRVTLPELSPKLEADFGKSQTVIAVDSPPEKEKNQEFLRIARCLVDHGFNAPVIKAVNEKQGFMLLSDLGDRPMLPELDTHTVEKHYAAAMETLCALQKEIKPAALVLPHYDHQRLMDEMALFPDWFICCHLGCSLRPDQDKGLHDACELLAQSALAQPQVFVHRDYHSRNIMLLDDNQQGLIDFQDAVWGPITYDLVSLLRDSYVRWPREKSLAWAAGYFRQALAEGLLPEGYQEKDFLKQFEWMGAQRHLKVVGIFSRLKHRDDKPVYLDDIPCTYANLLEVCGAYEELAGLHGLLQELARALITKTPSAAELMEPLI